MVKSNKCPFTPINISKDRKIVYTDKIKFPWKQDKRGYFLVKIENKTIYCGFVNSKHKMIIELRGKDPFNMVKEITKMNFCNKDNLAYIAQELVLAYNCIKNKKKYIQR